MILVRNRENSMSLYCHIVLPMVLTSLNRWLYQWFTGLDANFRLTRLNISSAAKDPSLNKGCAYFVGDYQFQQHLHTMSGRWPVEPSDCSDHDAIKLANKCGEKNLSVTGVGMATCTRHDTVRSQSVADLRLGEE